MREYQYLHVKGIPFFKDQKFDLSQPGITAILGLNTNSGKTGNTNFVGKSLFFSQLMEVMAPNKEFTNPKDRMRSGFAEVGVRVGKNEFKIRRVYKSPEKLQVTKNGTLIDHHSLGDAKAYVSQLVGYSPDVLSLLMYLDNTKTHSLRTGDTGVRRKFFTEFFSRAAADEIKKMIKSDKDELQAKALVFEELKSRMAELKANRVNLDVKKLPAQLDVAREASKRAMTRLEGLRRIDQIASFIRANERAWMAFGRYDGQEAKLKERLRKYNKWLASAEALAEYQAQVKAFKKQRLALESYLAENKLTDFDAREAKSTAESLADGVKQAEKAYSDELRTYFQKEAKKADLEASLETAEKALKRLKPEGECSKCGQAITNKHYKKEKAELTADVQRLREEIEAFELGDKPEKPEPPKALMRIQRQLELWAERPRLPEKPEKPESIDDIPDDMEDVSAKRDKVRSILQALKTVEDSGFAEELREDNFQPLRDGEYEEGLRDATVATENAARLEAELSRAEALNREGRDLSTRMKVLAKELEDFEVLDVLGKAYAGDRAGSIKQIIISSLCDKLEEQVNKYSKLLLPEDYTFSFDLQTQFSIIVTRNVGGKQIASDVRRLSGAEASCFNLILTLALLTFVPPAKRPSILVLDEFNANFSAEMTSGFVRFLPVLNQVIPHVIIITPRTEDNYGEHVRYFTVIKKGSESRIFPGKHRTMPKSTTTRKAA